LCIFHMLSKCRVIHLSTWHGRYTRRTWSHALLQANVANYFPCLVQIHWSDRYLQWVNN
jgi:hypothetical protein